MYSSRFHFCPQCGHPLNQQPIGGYLRDICPNCSYIHWGDFTMGVGGVLWHHGKVLLVQRALNPGKGMWTIPGGYVEQGEKIEEGIKREIREETGLETEPVSLIAVRDRPGTEQPHDLYLIFLMRYLRGIPLPDHEEITSMGFFTLEESRRLPVAQLTVSMLEATNINQTGFQRVEGMQLTGTLSTLYRGK